MKSQTDKSSLIEEMAKENLSQQARLHEEMAKLSFKVENNCNHFALVENFVEKYLPI